MGDFAAPLLLVRCVAVVVRAGCWFIRRHPGFVLTATAVWLLSTGGKGW